MIATIAIAFSRNYIKVLFDNTKPKAVYDAIREMEEVSSYEAYDNNVPKGTDPRLYESKVHPDTGAGGRALHQVRGDRRQYPEGDTGREREEAAEPEENRFIELSTVLCWCHVVTLPLIDIQDPVSYNQGMYWQYLIKQSLFIFTHN